MPGITLSRWLPLVVVLAILPFLHATKILKITETTKESLAPACCSLGYITFLTRYKDTKNN